MKIAILMHDLNGGGAEKIMIGFLNYLVSSSEDDIYLILNKNEGHYLSIISPKVKIICLNKSSSFFAIIPLYRALRFLDVDVIYSTLTNANLVGCLMGKLFKIKVIIREANTIEVYKTTKKKFNDNISIFSIKYVYGLAFRCIAISNIVKKDLILNTNLSADKIKVIYNPILIIDNKNHHHLSTEFFHVGLVSRLSLQKNIPEICKIIEECGERNYKIQFHFFGDGPEEFLLEEVNNRFVDKELIVIHGFDLSYFSCVKNMQLFIHLPLWEGLGNSVLEVFNSGIPMILSNINSGYSELISGDNSNIHYVAPQGNTNKIVGLIQDYLEETIEIIPNRPKLEISEVEIYDLYRSLVTT
jgi:glycosyltransferase involved in cell wall biosynthesis